MFRKFALALAATAVGFTAIGPGTTPAAAGKWHKHHHHKHWHGHHFYGPVYASYYRGCYVKRYVATPWGLQRRWVNICYY